MTEAVRRRFDLLDQQYTRTLQQRTLQQQTLQYSHAGSSAASPAGTGAWDMAHMHAHAERVPAVEPQLLTVTVQGRVLSKAHIQAGSYIPAAEQADALKLLAGEAAEWLLLLTERSQSGACKQAIVCWHAQC